MIGIASKYSPSPGDDRRIGDSNRGKPGDDKLVALKNYRKVKGLCFKCGEKWSPGHRCQVVSLYAMEEVWEFLFDEHEPGEIQEQVEDENDSGEDLMALLVQAVKGTKGVRTVRIRVSKIVLRAIPTHSWAATKKRWRSFNTSFTWISTLHT